MTPAEPAALRSVVSRQSTMFSRTVTAQEIGASPRVMASLTRKGLVSSYPNSEQIRGERRVTWREYRITELGRDKFREIDRP